MRSIIVIPALLVAMAVLSQACDPLEFLHFRNDTVEVLFVQVNGGGLDELPPQSTKNLGYPLSRVGDGDDRLTIVIADDEGCVVLRVDTTLERFRDDEDSRLTISPSDLPTKEERTDCRPELAD